MTRVLVAGGGQIARRLYLPYFAAHPDAHDVFVLDVDPAVAKAAAEQTPGVAVHEGSVRDAGADLVVIATPPDTHAALALEAISAGARTVVSEKPLALDPVEAAEVVAAAAAAGVRLHPSYTTRWRPEAALLRRMIAAGELGTVHHVEARWERRHGRPATSAAQAGVVWDLAPHVVDLALWVTGWPAAGHAWARNLTLSPTAATAGWYAAPASTPDQPPDPDGVPDTLVGHAHIPDHGLISVLVSWDSPVEHDTVQVSVSGETGRAVWTTVLGYSPDRHTVAGPALVLHRPGQATTVVYGQQLRDPHEYTTQLATLLPLGQPAPRQADLPTAVASTAVCHALAVSARIGYSVEITDPSGVTW